MLRDDGILWLNLGDSYASSGIMSTADKRNATRAATLTGGKTPPGGRAPTPPGLKSKDLIGIPWRVAFALQADGWYLRSDIIWAKPNPMPESVTDRPTKSHEYVFLLTKKARYWYDQEAIKEEAKDDKETFYKKLIKKPHKTIKDDPELNRLHRTKSGLHKATFNPAGRNARVYQ